MRKPDSTIDIIGSSFQLANGVIGLINDFKLSPEQRDSNRKKRKARVAIRQLKKRFKTVSVASYVKVNFSEYSEEEQNEIVGYISEIVGR